MPDSVLHSKVSGVERLLQVLTWGQVQLVERLELVCEVSVVHGTCGARQRGGHWQEVPKLHTGPGPPSPLGFQPGRVAPSWGSLPGMLHPLGSAA